MCPTWVTEARTVQCTECRAETRTCTVNVCRLVPETIQVQRQCTIMCPEVQTRTVSYTCCRPVWNDVQRTYTVMVPYTEMRQCTRQVCRMTPVQQTRTVCEDQGHWEERPCTPPPACAPAACAPAACAAAACTPATYRCWVPNVVQKQVAVTCMMPTMTTENYNVPVTCCRPETRTCTVRVCHLEQVPMTARFRARSVFPR